MLLSKKTSIKVSREYANLIGHMCYAASKLWNVCNYERQHYKETGIEQYPDWYYQKKTHKEDLWYKQLPSQTAQEVCRLLDKAWKSFYALKRSGGGLRLPDRRGLSRKVSPITYMQMGIVHERDTGIEQRTENPCVPGSIPGGTTLKRIKDNEILISKRNQDFLFSSSM